MPNSSRKACLSLHFVATSALLLVGTLPVGTLLVGCGGGVSPTTIASAQSAFDQAQELVGSGDLAGAMPLLDQAIADPGLDAEQYVEACLLRARCHATAGDAEKAQADLQEAEQGSADEALLCFTRGFVLSAQGKESEAAKEFAKARRLDPSLKRP